MNTTISSTSNYTMSNNDAIQVALENGMTKRIRVVGSVYDPHFFGKDVCEIMEVKDVKDILQVLVPENQKSTLKDLIEREINGIRRLEEVGGLKPPTLFGSFNLETLSHNDGRAVVLSEPGLLSLLNGSRKNKNKKKILEAVNRWLCATKYQNNAGLLDIFTFISRMDLTFDITSDWFKDLWYPLSKSQGSPGAALNKVTNEPQNQIILTQNLLEWMGYKGRKEADKQFSFIRFLESLKIEYSEIDYQHPLAIEYPHIQKEVQLVPKNNLEKKRWICIEPRAFKKVVMRLNTKNADMVRDYYLNLEEAMFAYGEYTRDYLMDKTRQQESGLTLAMEQLSIRDTELQEQERLVEQEREAKEEAERLAEEQERLRVETEQELADTREHALILQEMMVKDEPIARTQVIYIATTELYAKSNNFKPGGVDDVSKLKSRLGTYNTGRVTEDLFYYSDTFLVSNYHIIEAQLKNLLGRFRNKKEKEMYRIHYDDLKYIVEHLCETDGKDVELVNSKLTLSSPKGLKGKPFRPKGPNTLLCAQRAHNKVFETMKGITQFIANLNRRNKVPVVPVPDTKHISSTTSLNSDGTVVNATIQASTSKDFEAKLKEYIQKLDSSITCISKRKVFDDLKVRKDRINKIPILQRLLGQFRPNVKLIMTQYKT